MRVLKNIVISLQIFTLVCTQSLPIPDIAFSSPLPSERIAKPFGVELKNSLESFGEIQEDFKGETASTVILIQDLHCDLQAQTNIIKSLSRLSHLGNEPLFVGIEGAKGSVDTSFLRDIPDEKIRKEILSDFLNEGFISGSEYFSILNHETFLYGLEQKKAYLDNLKAFQNTFKNRESLNPILDQLDRLIEDKAQTIFGNEYNAFRKLSHTENLKDTIPFLCLAAKNHKIDMAPFHQMLIFEKTQTLSLEINPETLQNELDSLILLLKTKLSSEDLKKLITQSLYYRMGRNEAKSYFLFLKNISRRNHIPWNSRPHLKKQVLMEKDFKKLHLQELLKEEDLLLSKLKQEWIRDPQAKALDRLMEKLRLLRDLSLLQLNRFKLNSFLREENQYSPEQIALDLKQLSISLKQAELTHLTEGLKSGIDFYKHALKRDRLLFKHALKKLQESPSRPFVLITGGFHSDGITHRLKKHKISYLSFIPKTNALQGPDLYWDIMQGRRSAVKYFLSQSASRLAPRVREPNELAKPAEIADLVIASYLKLLINHPKEALDWARLKEIKTEFDFQEKRVMISTVQGSQLIISFLDLSRRFPNDGMTFNEWLIKIKGGLDNLEDKIYWSQFIKHEMNNALTQMQFLPFFGAKLDKEFPALWNPFYSFLETQSIDDASQFHYKNFEFYFSSRAKKIFDGVRIMNDSSSDKIQRLLSQFSDELKFIVRILPRRLIETNAFLKQFKDLRELEDYFDDISTMIDESVKGTFSQVKRRVILGEKINSFLTAECQTFGLPDPIQTLPSPYLPVMIQPSHLKQVVRNLVKNAMEAKTEGPRVQIRSSISLNESGTEAVLEIQDDGPGMPEAVLKNLFKLGQTTKESGHGIGLFLSRQMVENWGGEMTVISEVGRGTTFRITFPVAVPFTIPDEHDVHPIPFTVVEDYLEMSRKAANEVAGLIRHKRNAVLLLPTGNTPKGMYANLVEMARLGHLDLTQVTLFMLDEYQGGRDYHDFIYKNFINRLPDNNRPKAAHVLNGMAQNVSQETANYEKQIVDAGGIDLAVLGMGIEGHIAFNERGADLRTRTRLIKLASTTIEANTEAQEKGYTHALTTGISTILEARKILLLANSRKKAKGIEQLWELLPTSDFPASWLKLHGNVSALVDRDAAKKLPTPIKMNVDHAWTQNLINLSLERIENAPISSRTAERAVKTILTMKSNHKLWKFIIERTFNGVAKEGDLPQKIAALQHPGEAIDFISSMGDERLWTRVLAVYLMVGNMTGETSFLNQEAWLNNLTIQERTDIQSFAAAVHQRLSEDQLVSNLQAIDNDFYQIANEWIQWMKGLNELHPIHSSIEGTILEQGTRLLEKSSSFETRYKLKLIFNLLNAGYPLKRALINQLFTLNPMKHHAAARLKILSLLNPDLMIETVHPLPLETTTQRLIENAA